MQDIDNMLIDFNDYYIRTKLINNNNNSFLSTISNNTTNINFSFHECKEIRCIFSEINKSKYKYHSSSHSNHRKKFKEINL
jgi:hypothetical protein